MFPDFITSWAIVFSGCASLVEPPFFADRLADHEIRAWRETQRAALERRARQFKPQKTEGGVVYQTFYCSIYFTPMESGFTMERGFDTTPIAAHGLGGHTYGKAFLAAVKREGFGRLLKPVDRRSYIRYVTEGRYEFAKAPLGRRGNILVARKSCAISKNNPFLQHGATLRIGGRAVEQELGTGEWKADDTGGGLHPLQIDLYWGEDEPMGGVGRQQARPAGTRLECAFGVAVEVLEKPRGGNDG